LPTGHTPPGATLWPKGEPHFRPHRGGGPSPTGHLRHRLPHWPEKGRAKPPPHRPPTGHKGAALGGRPSHRPSLAKRGAPHWPPYRPSDAPPGPMATASLTGHLRAPYWSSGEAPLAKGEPHPSLASHWPPTDHPGRPHRPPPATTGRDGTPSPGPPPTGHLRTHSPHRPIVAFGRGWPKSRAPPPTPTY